MKRKHFILAVLVMVTLLNACALKVENIVEIDKSSDKIHFVPFVTISYNQGRKGTTS
jgi:hypothetical protein